LFILAVSLIIAFDVIWFLPVIIYALRRVFPSVFILCCVDGEGGLWCWEEGKKVEG
jgi:hypothetical protein